MKSSESGVPLKAGELATIVATVYSFSSESNTANFFYAANASNPTWVYIGSAKPTVSNELTEIERTYTIPLGSDIQAVRVQYTYNDGETINPCVNTVNGNWNERDDIVFKIRT